jgi:manganese/zinc/iron transport system ATP- binding protein
MKPALDVEGLQVSYEKIAVLWDLTFSLPQGVLCGIAGPNGAGKSTLLKAALGLTPCLSGKISFFGEPLSTVRGTIAYVPQRESVDWDFPITAFDLVLMGRANRFGLFGRPRQADRDAASRALEQVGMAPYANRQISQLSGGQQQRLFLARALVQEADLFLMDEPFSGIDLATEKEFVLLLRRLQQAGKTALIVFHDLPNAEEYFDWLLLLNRRLVAIGPVGSVLTPENLQRTFGKRESLFDEVQRLSATTNSGLAE